MGRDGGGRDGRDNFGRDGGRNNERDVVRGRNDLDLTTLEEMNLPELREVAKELNIAAATSLKKSDLVFRILEAQAKTSGNLFKKGILEILPDGKGFLRTDGYLPGDEDVYVSQSQIKRFNLRTGDVVSGQVRAPKEMERYFSLLRVEAINGEAPDVMRTRKEFEKLTPIFPTQKFKLETTQENITARIIDLVSPIGKGQRGLIVAPPKAGKTTLIKNVANSIALNHPEVVLIVLLIDERPEEVTDISRSVKGEVVASTFDEMPENHMRVADMVMEKAKRMVEQKRDVVILLDSITRLSRASNLVVTPSGRTLSGGLDPAAMYRPKRMFGAARNIEEGGSLTILATTLVDTGSRMDDMIFEEFKGTGNLDLVLDRSLFDQRIFPAIDINKSGTRRDDLLLSKEDLAATFHLRRTLAALDNDKAITLLIDRLKNTKTNADFMQIVQKSARQGPVQGS
ncbi:MAG: transcription termination factor Rho [Abitibacteriaceae bacterium]|nr:transcription termination factor Rho [Abditibacteriaceae bacterium]